MSTHFSCHHRSPTVYGWLLLLADVGLFYLVHRVHTRALCRLRRDGPTGSGLDVSSNSQLQGPEQYDAVEALRKRRKALYAQYYQEVQQQQNGAPPPLPPPAAAALQGEAGTAVGSVNTTSHSSLHGDMVLHHPPRQWGFGRFWCVGMCASCVWETSVCCNGIHSMLIHTHHRRGRRG